MATSPAPTRSTAEKLALFRQCFAGLTHVYGTYDPATGRVWQVKQPVTDQVLLDHLMGRQPYGVYLLVEDRTRAAAADFDQPDPESALRFLRRASELGLAVYLERSKSKGFHAWVFADLASVAAGKIRRVIQRVLADIGHPEVEVFPKQDRILTATGYGNFINAPLFGRLVPQGRTVFVDPAQDLAPFPDQWAVLASVERASEPLLDAILNSPANRESLLTPTTAKGPANPADDNCRFGLLPCARRMLQGVRDNQRVACFRLAVHLKRIGLPQNLTNALLKVWAARNQPAGGQVITHEEVAEQTRSAYDGRYHSFGCEDPIIQAHCHPACPVLLQSRRSKEVLPGPNVYSSQDFSLEIHHANCSATPATPALR